MNWVDAIANLILTFGHWLLPFVILDEFERGVVLRLGRYKRYAEPGWNWIWPIGIERVISINVVPTSFDLPYQSSVTKDLQSVTWDLIVIWGVRDPKKILLEVEDYRAVLADAAAGLVRDYVHGKTWEELHSQESNDELTKMVRRRAFRFGVEVESVRFTTLSLLGVRHGVLRFPGLSNTGH